MSSETHVDPIRSLNFTPTNAFDLLQLRYTFVYQIVNAKSDLYLDMKDCMHLWDTSDYPKDHFLHSNKNKKVVGKFKDKTNGVPIKRFCGLRAKMYVYETENGQEIKKAKGIAKKRYK